MELPDEITVTIPFNGQEYDWRKYARMGSEHTRCYLEEALDNAGFFGSRVLSYGDTYFADANFVPTERFECGVVRKAFAAGKDVTVTLKKINNNN